MRVFLDTNILLDLLLERDGYQISASLFEGQDQDRWKLCVSIFTMVNAAYVYRKGAGIVDVVPNMKYLSMLLEVLPMSQNTLETGLYLHGKDFEDILQYVCAAEGGCDAIITRNAKDFVINDGLKEVPCSIPVYTPEEFLKHYL